MISHTLVLIGPPGSGKSSVGRRLARVLSAPFVDTDESIECAVGRSISTIFENFGEEKFREWERAIVTVALEAGGVVALGGGAPMDESIQRAMYGRAVVFLDLSVGTAAGRLEGDSQRPKLLIDDLRDSWSHLMAERRPTYMDLCTDRVLVDSRSVDEVVETLAESEGSVAQRHD